MKTVCGGDIFHPQTVELLGNFGRSDRIRTYDPLIPNQMRYQAALRSEERRIIAGSKRRRQLPFAVIFSARLAAVIDGGERCQGGQRKFCAG